MLDFKNRPLFARVVAIESISATACRACPAVAFKRIAIRFGPMADSAQIVRYLARVGAFVDSPINRLGGGRPYWDRSRAGRVQCPSSTHLWRARRRHGLPETLPSPVPAPAPALARPRPLDDKRLARVRQLRRFYRVRSFRRSEKSRRKTLTSSGEKDVSRNMGILSTHGLSDQNG